jgi:hypothetical protein
MARHNNTGRSLIIMSKLQGWDPCKIDGTPYPGGEYHEEKTTAGFSPEAMGGFGVVKDPQGAVPDPSAPGGDSRSPGPGGKSSGVHDPNAGK